jgi:hypothetical protein
MEASKVPQIQHQYVAIETTTKVRSRHIHFESLDEVLERRRPVSPAIEKRSG